MYSTEKLRSVWQKSGFQLSVDFDQDITLVWRWLSSLIGELLVYFWFYDTRLKTAD